MELVKTDQSMAAQYEYGPFGEIIGATGPLAQANAFCFSTKYLDRETALLYYGYRYYNPSVGRWLSRDPSEEMGGANLFEFAQNNSVNQIDNLGLQLSPSVAAFGWKFGVPSSGETPVHITGDPVDMFIYYFVNGGNSAILSQQYIDIVVNSPDVQNFKDNLTTSAKALMCKTPCGQNGHYEISPLNDDEIYPFSAFLTGKWQLYAVGEVTWESKSDGNGGCLQTAHGSIKGYVYKAYMFEKIPGGNSANWTTTYLAFFPSFALPFGGPYMITGDFNVDFDFKNNCSCKQQPK
jgi:RHS repeat-associated protein